MEQTHTIINIGRQFGSGGKSVATELSRKLGIPVYDQELLSKASEQSGISQSFFQKSDEKKRSSMLGNFFSSNRYGSFTHSSITDAELFKITSDTIRDIASKGPAIFVGRASDYVLRDMDCLDVFISAPLDVRKGWVSRRHEISLEEAEKMILREDQGRKDYYNLYTLGHWGMASNYDLCIDSSVLGIEGTADQIIAFGKAAGLIKI